MIIKVDYSTGLKLREKLPSHALIDPFKKCKCFAFYNEKNEPIYASFQPIIKTLEMSRSNYMVQLYR